MDNEKDGPLISLINTDDKIQLILMIKVASLENQTPIGAEAKLVFKELIS